MGQYRFDENMNICEAEEDVVNHPSHYCQEGSMECIDEMIAIFGKTAVKHFLSSECLEV